MFNRSECVYFGDEMGNPFSYFEHFSRHQINEWLADGTVVEAFMPAPTKKNQERTIRVYRWSGVRNFKPRDKSAQMPGYVTEGAIIHENRLYLADVDAWRGISTPEFRGSRAVRPGIRLLLNSEAALA